MAMMAEREIKLHNLDSKSKTLQGSANSFARQARRVQWETKMQKVRCWATAILLVIWGVLFFVFRKHLMVYLASSAGVFTFLFLIQHCLIRRWRAQMEAPDTQTNSRGPLE